MIEHFIVSKNPLCRLSDIVVRIKSFDSVIKIMFFDEKMFECLAGFLLRKFCSNGDF